INIACSEMRSRCDLLCMSLTRSEKTSFDRESRPSWPSPLLVDAPEQFGEIQGPIAVPDDRRCRVCQLRNEVFHNRSDLLHPKFRAEEGAHRANNRVEICLAPTDLLPELPAAQCDVVLARGLRRRGPAVAGGEETGELEALFLVFRLQPSDGSRQVLPRAHRHAVPAHLHLVALHRPLVRYLEVDIHRVSRLARAGMTCLRNQLEKVAHGLLLGGEKHSLDLESGPVLDGFRPPYLEEEGVC